MIVAITMTRQFEKIFESLKKKIGTEPRKRPIVVNPKARPGAFWSTETISARVIDIVMEKSITPISETIIKLSPKRRKGKAPNTLRVAVFLIPILSHKIPPKAFPVPIKT